MNHSEKYKAQSIWTGGLATLKKNGMQTEMYTPFTGSLSLTYAILPQTNMLYSSWCDRFGGARRSIKILFRSDITFDIPRATKSRVRKGHNQKSHRDNLAGRGWLGQTDMDNSPSPRYSSDEEMTAHPDGETWGTTANGKLTRSSGY